MYSRAFALALLIGTSVSLGAIQNLPPSAPGLVPRDNAQQPAVATSRIRGRVVAADSGQPIRKAVVRVTAPELREMRMTSTNPEGRYEFRDLPAGRYTVTASKGAYVMLAYGQTRPFEPGRPLQLLDNQSVEKIDFALPRGAIVTGRVLDEYGDTVADAQVAPMRMQFTPQGRRPTPAGRFGSTNDIGEFRLFGLPPGDYVLSATLRSFDGPMGNSDDRSGYAATYYPSTANVGEAQAVHVRVGDTLNEVTITLVPARTARVSGVVLDAEGQPVSSGSITVIQQSNGTFFGNSGGPIRPDGTFSIGGLAPGDYSLRAQTGPFGPNPRPELAITTVTVNGADVTGLRLTPARLGTIRGKVVVDPASVGGLQPQLIRLTPTPRSFTSGIGLPQPPQPVREDGTFELTAYPGPVNVNIVQAPGWMVKSERLNGTDVLDSGLEIRADEDVVGVEIVVTNRLPELSGGVTDDRSRPVIDYTAIAFPQDRAAAGAIVRSTVARPDQDGRFKFRPLRPGNYYVVAVDAVEQGQWLDPEYLEQLRSSATRVTIGEGETKIVDLKIVSQSHP